MRYVMEYATGRYTHAVYRGCGTAGCKYERSDNALASWSYCPLCGSPLSDISVPLTSPATGTAA